MPFPFATHISQESRTYRDAKGNTSTFRFYYDWTADASGSVAVTDLGTFTVALSALSNAALQASHGLLTEYGVAQYGVHNANGAYESVIEKAVLVFQDSAGTLHRFQVPAPKIAIFKADKVTVDPANALVIAFVAQMTAAGAGGGLPVTRVDLPYVNFMGGVYRSAKIRRRLNILMLEPDLTGALPAE